MNQIIWVINFWKPPAAVTLLAVQPVVLLSPPRCVISWALSVSTCATPTKTIKNVTVLNQWKFTKFHRVSRLTLALACQRERRTEFWKVLSRSEPDALSERGEIFLEPRGRKVAEEGLESGLEKASEKGREERRELPVIHSSDRTFHSVSRNKRVAGRDRSFFYQRIGSQGKRIWHICDRL